MENKDFLLRELEKFSEVTLFITNNKERPNLEVYEQELINTYKEVFGLDFDFSIQDELENRNFDYLHSLFSLLLYDIKRANSINRNKIKALEVVVGKIENSGVHIFNGQEKLNEAKTIIAKNDI